MQLIASDIKRVIVGLGVTGQSCARYFSARAIPFSVVDSRSNPPGLDAFRQQFPDVPVFLGDLQQAGLEQADELLVSPGVSLQEPAIAAALEAGVRLNSDIDLFVEAVTAPVVAITGSNGKSTVTTLVAELLQAAGKTAIAAGNLGLPVLDLLDQPAVDVYVLELSSFQLERCQPLNAEVATVLNVSPDHMDRYPNMVAYHQAKHRIFRGCRQVLINRDDPLTRPLVADEVKQWSFGSGAPDFAGFGVIQQQGQAWLAFEFTALMPLSELQLVGQHNVLNALAALAIVHALGIKPEQCLTALASFNGLAHRCQFVRELQGVAYFNDSKATNPGACIAAVRGFSAGTVVLIAGGDSKNLDLSPLLPVVQQCCRAVVLIGAAATELQAMLSSSVPVTLADSMQEAVEKAAELAQPGDQVLLSPACASFDMFENYQQRGELFCQAVESLAAGGAA